jgi:hypothetical protein
MERYIKLIKEFYPYIKSEVIQAIEMGPPPDDHKCDPECDDCAWYKWGMSFKQRMDKGEFDEFNS